jgi:predicted GNAT family N-acyltransferase
MTAIQVRQITEAGVLDEIYRLRFKVYHGELGAQLASEALRDKALRDPVDAIAFHYAAFIDGRVVGCVRVFDLNRLDDRSDVLERYQAQSAIQKIGIDSIALTGRMVVEASFRGGAMALRLMLAATEHARQRGIRVAFLDCSPHLLSFYEPCGFYRCAPAFTDAVFGFKQPLMLLLRDKVRLHSLRSPLAMTGSFYDDDPLVRDWHISQRNQFGERVHADLLRSARLDEFRGAHRATLSSLTHNKVERLVHKGTVAHARRGVHVCLKGLHDDYIGVVLSGALQEGPGPSAAILRRGESFGESDVLFRQPRGKDIVALDDTDILILPGQPIRGGLLDALGQRPALTREAPVSIQA